MLLSSSSILQPKGYHMKTIVPIIGDEGSLRLIVWQYLDLAKTNKSIYEN